MPRRRVTIKQVAEKAGVSVYGASRALNDLDGVAPDTRQRVLDAADELGYIPNSMARSLRRHTSRAIGVLTSNSANAFYSLLLAGLESVVRPDDYHTVVSDATEGGEYSAAREELFVESLIQLRVAAVVLTYRPQPKVLQTLLSWEIPVVFVDCKPTDEHAQIPWVMNDGESASYEAGLHFGEHGYRHWALVAHSKGWPTREARERGFRRAAAECGATLDVIEAGNDTTPAFGAVRDYLATPAAAGVQALYATNDLLLNGAIRALRQAGLAVGRDVGIIGFDDFSWADVFEPPITVIDQHIRRTGEIAGHLLLAAVAGNGSAPELDAPEPELKIRSSCGPHDESGSPAHR